MDVGQVGHNRHHRVGVGVCLGSGAAQLVVEFPQIFDHLIFMTEDLDNTDAVHHFSI